MSNNKAVFLVKRDYNILLNTIELVKDFVTMTGSIDGDITLRSDVYVINGKSIMGIFSLDLTHSLNCEIQATEDMIQKFEDGLSSLGLI